MDSQLRVSAHVPCACLIDAATTHRWDYFPLHVSFSFLGTIGFALYALDLSRWGRIEEGQKYGQITLQLMERQRFIEYDSKVFVSLGVGPVFATRPLKEANDLLVASHSQGIQTGDLEVCFSSAKQLHLPIHSILTFFLLLCTDCHAGLFFNFAVGIDDRHPFDTSG